VVEVKPEVEPEEDAMRSRVIQNGTSETSKAGPGQQVPVVELTGGGGSEVQRHPRRGSSTMRSRRAFIGAAAIVLSYPVAVAVQLLFDRGGDTLIHLVMGSGFVLFATSVVDFQLPRWVNVVGAAAAGTFGVIFLLQGVSDLTHIEPLRHVAFDVLGHQVERLLPDVVYAWFVALLLMSSWGKSRFLGWVVMTIVVGLEIATLITLLLGAPMPSVKVLILLPFVWLLFESAKAAPTGTRGGRPGEAAVAARHEG
jgi:hypothetical protein